MDGVGDVKNKRQKTVQVEEHEQTGMRGHLQCQLQL